MQCLLLIPEKPLFEPSGTSIRPQSFKTSFLSKKVGKVNFKLVCYCNYRKKNQENSECQFFIKFENFILEQLWPLLAEEKPKKTLQILFQKTELHLFLSQMTTLLRAENNKRNTASSSKAKSGRKVKQTNIWRDFYRTFSWWIQKAERTCMKFYSTLNKSVQQVSQSDTSKSMFPYHVARFSFKDISTTRLGSAKY